MNLDLDAIAGEYGIDKTLIDTEKEQVYKDIYDDFLKRRSDYSDEKDEIHRHIKKVYDLGVALWITSRIKDKKHLIEKIIRSGITEGKSKYKNIDSTNYSSIIRDLIGFRIIILAREDWETVHEFLLGKFANGENFHSTGELDENIPDDDNHYIVEKVQVHTIKGDEDTYDSSKYPELDIQSSKNNYRSVHYIVKHKTYYYEIQVRTIFEEGWLEFDHQIRYPNDKDNIIKQEFVSIMSNMARLSSEMVSYYRKHKNSFEKENTEGKINKDEVVNRKTYDKEKSDLDTTLLKRAQNYIQNL